MSAYVIEKSTGVYMSATGCLSNDPEPMPLHIAKKLAQKWNASIAKFAPKSTAQYVVAYEPSNE